MKTDIAQRYTVGALLALLAYLMGCSAPFDLTVSPTTDLLSATATPVSMVHSSPTPRLEQSTVTPTLRAIHPTSTPTVTPAPTLMAEEQHILVSNMLQDNGGCQLPCWWGFTPGQTSWQMAKRFFDSWGKEAEQYHDAHTTNYTIYLHNLDRKYFYRQIYYEEEGKIVLIVINAGPTDGIGYTYGDPQFAEIWKPYMLPEILEVYGLPSQVFLGTGGAPWLPFDLLLFYPDKGFLVQYSGVTEEGNSGLRQVCPHRVEIALYLWSPRSYMNLEDVPSVVIAHADDEKWGPYSLGKATGMSIEQFYQIFVQPEHQTCLEVPADLW
ncbi:MAG: hypothetical protein WHX52_22665 [Anaerolineae bacterium]